MTPPDETKACERIELASNMHSANSLDIQVLEEFETSKLLLQLDQELSQFNIFEAVGVTKQELRHSDFLSFLLDPNKPHALGDALAKKLLQSVLNKDAASNVELSIIIANDVSLVESVVFRERHSIDICFENVVHRLIILIENKIGSREHSNQLHRYLDIVNRLYPNWTIVPILLSPDGMAPQETSYVAMDYSDISEMISQLNAEFGQKLEPAVTMAMTDYVRILRRHIVIDTETAELCRSIYRRHRKAIDLVNFHRPSLTTEIREFLINLIKATPEVEYEDSPKPFHIQFAVSVWDRPWLLTAQKWVRSGRVLLFQFNNHEDVLGLHLLVGPGPSDTRNTLIERANMAAPPFRPIPSRSQKFSIVYEKEILRHSDHGTEDVLAMERRILEAWDEFIRHELPSLVEALNIDELQ